MPLREAFITVAELGEFGLIAAIAARLPRGQAAIVGIGDDAAVLAAPDGRVVATTDLLIEGRHFRREWSSPADIGVKAAARNLADIAAMGAEPVALLAGFAAPDDLPVSWAEELASGMAQECARCGAIVAGGDVSGADTVMLALTALGTLAGRDPVTRAGARPGDLLAVAGALGQSAAGLALLAAGLTRPAATPEAEPSHPAATPEAEPSHPAATPEAEPSHPAATPEAGPAEEAALLAAYRRPQPPYDAGPEAALLGATAMIDVSDGLLADIGHVAAASGVSIDVDTSLLAGRVLGPDGGTALRAAAAALGLPDPLRWVLTGGEDHALAATFPPDTALPDRWAVIARAGTGSGIRLDGRPYQGAGGWDHFR